MLHRIYTIIRNVCIKKTDIHIVNRVSLIDHTQFIIIIYIHNNILMYSTAERKEK